MEKRSYDADTAGGNAHTGDSSDVNGGSVANVADDDGTITNNDSCELFIVAPSAWLFTPLFYIAFGGNGGETATGNADGGNGNGRGPGGNASTGNSGNARGGNVANLGGNVDNTGGSNIAGNGGTSTTGTAVGGNVNGSRLDDDGDDFDDDFEDDITDDVDDRKRK